ncbi:MAG: pyruvate, water dikinase [Parcubacteria group bacterium Athens1014_10]|nr:MAG: pyruvate, water dikinase [Parcubacteria group bacterium Athens1014_10]TSD05162.1 MAG: pyruvate, water dikinase [Parcubacteria group bacterium Athens0714_12]
MKNEKFILWFDEIGIKDVPLVGGKNASLGEMYQKLTKKGMIIPNGFAVTSYAYWHFLNNSQSKNSVIPSEIKDPVSLKVKNLKQAIKEILKDLDTQDIKNLSERGKKIRDLILKAEFPEDLKKEIIKAYKKLSQEYGKENLDVAVRSSATAEDLATASFAGQQESYLNIKGEKQILEAVKKCIASLFTNRAISYRQEMGFDNLKVALSVAVQKMVRSDKASSGVMFSCDTESGFADVVLINAAYGLGENVVKGRVSPDQYYVFETTLKKGFKPLIGKTLGAKEMRLIYSEGNEPTKNLPVPKNEQQEFALKDEEVLTLAKWSCLIEDHYKKSMDIEWAKDGLDGKLYILQARPETVQSQKEASVLEDYILKEKGKILFTGLSVGSRIGQGKVNRIMEVKDINKFKKGEVLVTDMTDPDWEPVMKIASAIITDLGGRTSHAAIVSRELGVPCVVGAKKASQILKTGMEVTVSCAEGEEGKIYQGILPFEIKKTNIANLKKPKTKIMMNLGEPDQAFSARFIPNDGVGLAREEFIINNSIKIHPLALINFSKIKDEKIKNKIEKLTFGYKNKTQFYIDKLAEGIGKIGAAFYPRDVIVRFSDFKTNEYANLIGGKEFEPEESNPMIGWRGASRYYDPKFKSAFGLECLAIKKVREEFGLTNVIVMIPFCRTIDEGKKVLKIMEEYGLKRGKNGLQVYVMAEIPANIILAEEFAKIFDGFSIGSNDLTQLTLGLDRDSQIVSHIFNERNQAVKDLIKQLIQASHKYKRKVGICGQAPSDYVEFAEFLVKQGIDSISLNPDTIIKTTLAILKLEKRSG